MKRFHRLYNHKTTLYHWFGDFGTKAVTMSVCLGATVCGWHDGVREYLLIGSAWEETCQSHCIPVLKQTLVSGCFYSKCNHHLKKQSSCCVDDDMKLIIESMNPLGTWTHAAAIRKNAGNAFHPLFISSSLFFPICSIEAPGINSASCCRYDVLLNCIKFPLIVN